MNTINDLKVFVISGPSGSGKTSLCLEALKRLPWLQASVSHTTRKARPGEREGRDYHFVERETFDSMIAKDEFLEWAYVHGHLYGSSARNLQIKENGKGLLFEVDCKGARQLREKVPAAVLIFVMTTTFKELIARIQRRGNMDKEELATRLRTAKEEIQQIGSFDFLVINDDFEMAYEQIQSILLGDRSHRDDSAAFWIKRWNQEIHLLSNELEI